MKKAKKIQYGIEITKPWSKEMYAHNEMVAEAVKVKVHIMWINAYNAIDCTDEEFASDLEYAAEATPEMIKIQKAITVYSFGHGYDVAEVARRVEQELEDAPLYRLNEIAEELELGLKVGFVGFN